MTAVDPLGTLPMFAAPEPARRPTSKTPPATARPVWAKYRPKTAANCHDCLTHLQESRGHAPAPEKARHRRTAGGRTRLLCDQHAQQQREADKGLTP